MVYAGSFIAASRAADLVKVKCSTPEAAHVSEQDLQRRTTQLIEPFAPQALHELKIDTDSDAVADIAYRVLFCPPKTVPKPRRCAALRGACGGNGPVYPSNRFQHSRSEGVCGFSTNACDEFGRQIGPHLLDARSFRALRYPYVQPGLCG
jgi:hypothetical protein